MANKGYLRSAALVAGLGLATVAVADRGRDDVSETRQSAAAFRELLHCRELADPGARLACYDAKLASIATAEKAGDLVIADRAMVRESKKALFGYGGLNLPIFGGAAAADAPTQIEAIVRSVRRISHTRVEVTLDNDMTWRQVDDEEVEPLAGQRATVRTAAMGSYMLKIGSRSIRVMRVR